MKKSIAVLVMLLLVLSLTACGGPKEVTNMPFSAQIAGTSFDGKYSGMTLDKVPEGEGKFRYTDDDTDITFVGEWEDGAIVGAGSLEYEGMTLEYLDETYTGTYSGDTVKGSPEGSGVFTADMKNGFFEYDGSWKKGEFNGNGSLRASNFVVTWVSGSKNDGEFTGEVKDGIPSGYGVFVSQNSEGEGWTYKGDWKDGRPHGIGILKFDNENYFPWDGTFTDGEFTPTPAEYLSLVGWRNDYTIPDNIYSFLKENEGMLKNHSTSSYNHEIDTHFDFTSFSKNPSRTGGKVIEFTGYVAQIEEWEDHGEDYFFVTVAGSNVVYIVYYCGYPSGIIEGNNAKMTGIPIAAFSYTSVTSLKVDAIVIAGISLEKIR